ncbi:MAG TPA: Glu/Leu/Phe/Val dehydrogenase [Firmicutes bacterium]|nr:Glu/Leu/Phe/Val dehydrogenase [Bacillota bacterium]
MSIFKMMEESGCEQVTFCYDKSSGLKAIIVIHDTTLGPALGGCRMWPYKTEEEALRDGIRLARGMTYKNAGSGLNYGGGKTVIWGDPKEKSEEMFRALGRFVGGFNGRYMTGTDVGTTPDDFVFSRHETRWVVGLPEEYGGGGSTAIPTAYGVFEGIRATLEEAFGDPSLKGRRVAVQGLGKVGSLLTGMLIDAGAHVTACDVLPDNVARVKEKYGAAIETVDPDFIFDVACDVFSPNALGAVLNDDTIPRLKCRVVAGAANNQLAEPRHGDQLHQRGILYAPDFIINAGGVIQAADELEGFRRERVMHKVRDITRRLRLVYRISKETGLPTHRAAEVMVEQRIAKLGHIQRIYMNPSA